MHRPTHSDFSVDASAPQYSIYAYNKFHADRFGHNQWQCLGHSPSADQALMEAEKLFQTDKFAKIEVKKKFFDTKKKRRSVTTFQVLEHKRQYQKLSLVFGGVIVLAILGLALLEIL